MFINLLLSLIISDRSKLMNICKFLVTYLIIKEETNNLQFLQKKIISLHLHVHILGY